MSPTRVEAYATEAQTQARLRQVSARHNREYSTATRWVYYSGATKSWMTVEHRGGQFVMSFFNACPCG